MKSTINSTLSVVKACVLALAMTMAFALNANAQQTNNVQTDRQRMTREQLAEVQARHIAKAVGLDEAMTQKYVETYSDCQKEIWALGPRMKRGADIEQRFERSRKVIDIREKYYNKYKKFLTLEQIQKAYNEERRVMAHMMRGKKGGMKGGMRWTKKPEQVKE